MKDIELTSKERTYLSAVLREKFDQIDWLEDATSDFDRADIIALQSRIDWMEAKQMASDLGLKIKKHELKRNF